VAQARAMHARGLSTDALALLDAHLRDHRKDAAAWAVRGVILLDMGGRVDDAVASLTRARRHAPRDATILNNLGWALLVEGKPSQAEEALRAALVQDPSSRRARNNLGIALARAGRDEEALAAFRAAGREADARVNLAAACEWRGDVPGALTHLRAALAAMPDHPAATAALARLAAP
jgi:Flp pilus assembly protein TadD